VIEDGRQAIAFVDPHGLGRTRGLKDPKIQLHRELAKLQPSLQAHCEKWRVKLTSFVVSPRPYDEVRRDTWVYSVPTRAEVEAEHVLFQEADAQYVRIIWKEIDSS
jgi:hypothetical protein